MRPALAAFMLALVLLAQAVFARAEGAEPSPPGMSAPQSKASGASPPGLRLAGGSAPVPATPKGNATPVDFGRDIRPILADTCYVCHGPDKSKRSTDLRLDTHEGAFVDLGGYHAIVPGKPDESPLIQRITSSDPDERMPPPKSGRQLNARQIELLKRWIADGAQWKDHWAFVRPQLPAQPAVKLKTWPRNGLDYFVLALQEHEGLTPSPEAAKETLIRRATLDLTGLPPTVAEVDAFLADTSADAYEKLVDRLLASPRYGEHMASAWLDAARYSDTNGYQVDGTRTMWPWRDWVVTALNNNMPFDQFTIEQLAGDLLPGATDQQKLATGFNRNHPLNGEGGRIPEESRVEYVVDRVDATATIWLGLTAGCARCHDHKYDPLSQREFYQLYAFFNNVAETGGVDRGANASPVMSIKIPNPRLSQVEAQLTELESELLTDSAQYAVTQEKWEADYKATPAPRGDFGPWLAAGPFEAANGERALDRDFGPEKTGQLVGGGADKTWKEQKWTDGELHALDMPANSAIYVMRTITATQPYLLDVSLGSDDGIKVWLNGESRLVKKVLRPVAADQDKIQLPIKTGENRLLIKIDNVAGPAGFYFSAALPGPPAAVRKALARPAEERTQEERDTVKRHYRSIAPEFAGMREKIDSLRKQSATLKKGSTLDAMVMAEQPKPREVFVLARGQWDAPDKKQPVKPNVPVCLPPLPADAPRNRLGLARWLVDPANPLTARVTVNRYWQQFFGEGLVRTPEDFGSQGEPPGNPKLLDWLATEFIASHWDVKAMHRLIVTSATYRQASRATPQLLERDPYNRLLARGPRFRLSSQALRDQALMLSGLLVEKVGGPPVNTYQPANVWDDFSLGQIKFVQDHGEALYRRSVYTFWRRSVAPTMLFDVASRQVCTVRPSRTNTPLHALTLLNEITYVEAARKMAARVLSEGGDAPAERLNRAFRLATARQAQPRETAVLLSALTRATDHFRAHPDAVQKLLKTGESPIDSKIDPVELAAYTSVMNVILNLDEVLTKE